VEGAVVITDDAGASSGLGWPPEDAFLVDEDLFGRLRLAYERGDRDALAQLWREARPVDLEVSEPTTDDSETDHSA